MTANYDYDSYGAFKESGTTRSGRLKKIARNLGFKNRYLRFLTGIPKDGILIELGCGDGGFMRELRAAGFVDVRGVDLSPSYAGVEHVHIGDAADYIAGFTIRSIDCIVALDVFEHIPQDQLRHLLRMAGTRLKPGGRVIFRVPNMGSPLALLNQHGDLSHVNAFNEISVRQIAFDTDMDVVAIHAEPLAYPRSPRGLMGMALWPVYRAGTKMVLAAFGVQPQILTPNLVAVLTPGHDNASC